MDDVPTIVLKPDEFLEFALASDEKITPESPTYSDIESNGKFPDEIPTNVNKQLTREECNGYYDNWSKWFQHLYWYYLVQLEPDINKKIGFVRGRDITGCEFSVNSNSDLIFSDGSTSLRESGFGWEDGRGTFQDFSLLSKIRKLVAADDWIVYEGKNIGIMAEDAIECKKGVTVYVFFVCTEDYKGEPDKGVIGGDTVIDGFNFINTYRDVNNYTGKIYIRRLGAVIIDEVDSSLIVVPRTQKGNKVFFNRLNQVDILDTPDVIAINEVIENELDIIGLAPKGMQEYKCYSSIQLTTGSELDFQINDGLYSFIFESVQPIVANAVFYTKDNNVILKNISSNTFSNYTIQCMSYVDTREQ